MNVSSIKALCWLTSSALLAGLGLFVHDFFYFNFHHLALALTVQHTQFRARTQQTLLFVRIKGQTGNITRRLGMQRQ